MPQEQQTVSEFFIRMAAEHADRPVDEMRRKQYQPLTRGMAFFLTGWAKEKYNVDLKLKFGDSLYDLICQVERKIAVHNAAAPPLNS